MGRPPAAGGHQFVWVPPQDVHGWSEKEQMGYFQEMYENQNALTAVQRYCLRNHAADLGRIDSQKPRASPLLAFVAFVFSIIGSAVAALVTNPTLPFVHPVNYAYGCLGYGFIWSGLFLAQVIFVVGYYLGLGTVMHNIRMTFAHGQSLVSWTDIDVYFEKRHVFDAALPIFASTAPRMPDPPVLDSYGDAPMGHETTLGLIEFNVDVARACILLSTLVYERIDTFVRAASEDRHRREAYLLRSEQLMYYWAQDFGLQFTSISDFETASGPFVGAFYKTTGLAPDQSPFIVVVFKGTDPSAYAEWITDCSCNLEDASDWLGAGFAHQGFYTSLFPSTPASLPSLPSGKPNMRVTPYSRIIETIRLIASTANTQKPTNVFVAGHSLGAGTASVFFARLLKSPEDVGRNVVIRDAYLFGTPRAVNRDCLSAIELSMRDPRNFGKSLFRVSNRGHCFTIGDIVTRVPFGLADNRQHRPAVTAQSLLSYGAMGIAVDLTPFGRDPFHKIYNIPVGQKVIVAKADGDPEDALKDRKMYAEFELPRTAGDLFECKWWINFMFFSMRIFAPFVYDHFPIQYYYHLGQLTAEEPRTGKTSRAADRRGAADLITNDTMLRQDGSWPTPAEAHQVPSFAHVVAGDSPTSQGVDEE